MALRDLIYPFADLLAPVVSALTPLLALQKKTAPPFPLERLGPFPKAPQITLLCKLFMLVLTVPKVVDYTSNTCLLHPYYVLIKGDNKNRTRIAVGLAIYVNCELVHNFMFYPLYKNNSLLHKDELFFRFWKVYNNCYVHLFTKCRHSF